MVTGAKWDTTNASTRTGWNRTDVLVSVYEGLFIANPSTGTRLNCYCRFYLTIISLVCKSPPGTDLVRPRQSTPEPVDLRSLLNGSRLLFPWLISSLTRHRFLSWLTITPSILWAYWLACSSIPSQRLSYKTLGHSARWPENHR